MNEISDKLQIIISISTIIGIIFLIYDKIRNPDIKTDKTLTVMKTMCDLKHRVIDDNFINITQTMQNLKDNDLHTLTENIQSVQKDQVKIFTILEERLPKK